MSEMEEATIVPYRDGYVKVGGARLHYVDYGGEGEAVVALHGFTGSAHVFDSIAPVLVPHVHLFALDQRGRGGSDWAAPELYKPKQSVIDLIEVLAALGLKRFALIGTSQGGAVARTYAFTHPDKVTRLVLNDSAPPTDRRSKTTRWAATAHLLERLAKVPAEFASLDEAAAWFMSERSGGMARLSPEMRANWVRHYLAPTPEGRWRFSCDPAMIRVAIEMLQARTEPQGKRARRGGIFRRAIHALRSAGERLGISWLDSTAAQWRMMMSRLTMPVLLLRGALSDLVPPEWADQLVKALPAARCVEVPGVGHAPTLHEPEAQAALREFFGIAAPTAARALVTSV